MSKKTRKKSPKPSPKTPSKKAAKTPAKKSGTSASRTPRRPRPKNRSRNRRTASHKATSKKLKAPAAPKPAAIAGENRRCDSGKAALLTEGAKAPAFQLPRDGGSSVSLADYPGKKLVIFFYPRADTPGCTKEAIDFTRLSGAFADSKTAVLGVSADPLKAQEAFRDKHELSIPLVSDETHEMLEAYGVWGEKSMYGKTFLGILRTTVLIDGQRQNRENLAQCEGRRPCRRGAGCRASAL